jgi:TolB protein
MIGEIIDGRYDVREFLNRDGIADVYRGIDIRLSRDVIIKMIQPKDIDNNTLDEFKRDAQTAFDLFGISDNTYVFDSGMFGDIPYFIMECLPGEAKIHDQDLLLERVSQKLETGTDRVRFESVKEKRGISPRSGKLGWIILLLTVGGGIGLLVFFSLWDRIFPRLSAESAVQIDPTLTITILPVDTETNSPTSATSELPDMVLSSKTQMNTPKTPTITLSPSSTLTSSPEPTITFTPTPIGGGGLIAFHSNLSGNNDIYVMKVDGTDLRQLTHESADERAPSWSPDGGSIAYKSNIDGDYDIYVIDLQTGNRWKVTDNDCDDHAPVWSPDGRQFVFYSDCDGNREIFVIDADGGNRKQLTETSGVYNWFAVWSPDGRQIAFSSNRNGKYQIHLMNVDGSNSRVLADGCLPFFSPNGEHIVFSQYCLDGGNIWLMDADGSKARAITKAPDDWNINPSWSADGKKIIFQLKKDQISEIWMMDVDGSNWVQLTDHSATAIGPVWQPGVGIWSNP